MVVSHAALSSDEVARVGAICQLENGGLQTSGSDLCLRNPGVTYAPARVGSRTQRTVRRALLVLAAQVSIARAYCCASTPVRWMQEAKAE